MQQVTTLDAYDNPNITSASASQGLKYVPLLTTLYANCNPNITDEGLKFVPLLTELNVTQILLMKGVPLLTKLVCI